MVGWIAFWDSRHSIYVNARHRDVHYRTIAHDIAAHVKPGTRVLDYGCGEALHAGRIAASARKLTLCDAAGAVRAALARRFGSHPRISIRAPEEVAALAAGSFDAIILHSVAQYLTTQELGALLADFHRLLQADGLLVLADIIPPHVSAATDALALLLGSQYWRLRWRLGLARYSEAAMIGKLAAAGFEARRAAANIGHNRARMTFLA